MCLFIYLFLFIFLKTLITITQAGDMASSHSRCIFKYSLFLLACRNITPRLNHELKSNTTEIDYVNNKARKDTNSITTYYLYSPIWKTFAQLKRLRSNSSTGLLITPSPYKHRSNKTATTFTVLLCIILSGDIQLNPGPFKCNSCKKSLKSNSLSLSCNDCNKSVHINVLEYPDMNLTVLTETLTHGIV